MKKLTTLLVTTAYTFTIINNSFGMKSEETSSDQCIKFDKVEKQRLQEQNNMLLQENNKLLRIIITQNQLISESERPQCYSIYTTQADRYRKLDAIYEQFKRDHNS